MRLLRYSRAAPDDCLRLTQALRQKPAQEHGRGLQGIQAVFRRASTPQPLRRWVPSLSLVRWRQHATLWRPRWQRFDRQTRRWHGPMQRNRRQGRLLAGQLSDRLPAGAAGAARAPRPQSGEVPFEQHLRKHDWC